MNSSGKVLVIFLAITAILLVSLTAISLFFFQKETERRKLAEAALEELKNEKTKLEENAEEMKKQNFLLQEKSKETEERLGDVSDELELEKGLREEMKLESATLEEKLKEMEQEKERFAKEAQEKETAHDKLSEEVSASQQTIKELEAQLKSEIERSQKLGELYEQQQAELAKLEESKTQLMAAVENNKSNTPEPEDVDDEGVELEEIVVNPVTGTVEEIAPPDFLYEESFPDLDADGRILSVDRETEFVIVSLGENHGISIGHVLSIYRNDNYMGDIKVTRTQPEMSAADLVRPLSIRKIKKDDQVKTKQ